MSGGLPPRVRCPSGTEKWRSTAPALPGVGKCPGLDCPGLALSTHTSAGWPWLKTTVLDQQQPGPCSGGEEAHRLGCLLPLGSSLGSIFPNTGGKAWSCLFSPQLSTIRKQLLPKCISEMTFKQHLGHCIHFTYYLYFWKQSGFKECIW